MNLDVTLYQEQAKEWPKTGRHILAQFDDHSVVVYQAYKPAIGHFAAEHGYFGGEFSYARMSWIKPNFLWMMYRSGWGTKPGQEVTLAIRLKRDYFDSLLREAVPSTFDDRLYKTYDEWQKAVAQSQVRLQWDPDHNPSGQKEERRAMQLGLRGEVLQGFKGGGILSIDDISEFVREQRANVKHTGFRGLVTPVEKVYPVSDLVIKRQLGLENQMADR